MNDRQDTLGSAGPENVVFSSSYGVFPRFFWCAVFPVLLFGSAVLFVRAVWFNEGIPLASIRVPPSVVAVVVCPMMWILCGLLIGLQIYRHRNPQFILVTSRGVTLPKGSFTAETISIAWDDLQAMMKGSNLIGWHVYEITCTDLESWASARISSALFRDFDDFATFSRILNEHMGQDWPIRGSWPGTVRGRKTVRPGGTGESNEAAI